MRKGAFAFMVQALEEILAKSSRIVFFGGAGVSTESGYFLFHRFAIHHFTYIATILFYISERFP